MISLKRHIELHPGELLDATLAAYCAALLAMGEGGAQACPALGRAFYQGLAALQEALAKSATPETVSSTEEKVEREIRDWGSHAAEYYRHKAREVREIMLVLARTAESVAQRDQRYVGEFHDVTRSLQSVADLEDLAAMRQSIVASASRLKASVETMTRDAQESVRQLQSELAAFQGRLEAADRLAYRDELTGLGNRRYLEAQLENRLAGGREFSVLMLDLNGFKRVNDEFGHLAGDELLKQFAGELRSTLRAGDVVARWGGDEFVVVLDCRLEEAQSYLERIQVWVFGDYTVRTGGRQTRVPLRAAVGLASSRAGDTVETLFQRVDAAMYGSKRPAPLAPSRKA